MAMSPPSPTSSTGASWAPTWTACSSACGRRCRPWNAAVVGLVRAAAPQLEAKGIRINAVCPGMVRTPLEGDVDEAALAAAGWPMMEPAQIADAVLQLVTGTETGQAFVCQAGREPTAYRFGGVPGPR